MSDAVEKTKRHKVSKGVISEFEYQEIIKRLMVQRKELEGVKNEY